MSEGMSDGRTDGRTDRTWAELDAAAARSTWPAAALSPTGRLRALEAGLPGVVAERRVFDAPFARVWDFIADLPRSVPTFDRSVASLDVLSREGTRLRARARSGRGFVRMPLAFDVDLEPGWCWMVSRPRLYVVGMAAEPDPDDAGRTVFVHLEGVPFGGRVLSPVARASRVVHRRHVRSDLDGMARALGLRP
jgi:hypothetical protein